MCCIIIFRYHWGGLLTALIPSCMDVNLKSGFFFLRRSLHAVFLNCPSDWENENRATTARQGMRFYNENKKSPGPANYQLAGDAAERIKSWGSGIDTPPHAAGGGEGARKPRDGEIRERT